MKLTHKLALAFLFAGALFAQAPQVPPKTTLKVGDVAPDFTLPQTKGNTPVKLSDFRGKKTVVLVFFPAAFTGG